MPPPYSLTGKALGLPESSGAHWPERLTQRTTQSIVASLPTRCFLRSCLEPKPTRSPIWRRSSSVMPPIANAYTMPPSQPTSTPKKNVLAWRSELCRKPFFPRSCDGYPQLPCGLRRQTLAFERCSWTGYGPSEVRGIIHPSWQWLVSKPPTGSGTALR